MRIDEGAIEDAVDVRSEQFAITRGYSADKTHCTPPFVGGGHALVPCHKEEMQYVHMRKSMHAYECIEPHAHC